MHILITGGAGFIGSHLADALLARGDKVTVLDNFDPYYDPRLKWRNISAAEEFKTYALVEGDIRDVGAVEQLMARARPDAVVHLAALAGVRDSIEQPLLFNEVNAGGTLAVLEAARIHGRPRFVLASSSSVYGISTRLPYQEDDPLLDPVSPYGASKIAAEKYAAIYHHVHGLPVVSLRFFTAYGPRCRPDMAMHRFASAILDGRTLQLYGDGSTSRDYTYVGDVVAAIVAALDGSLAHEVLNIGDSEAIELIGLVRMIEVACGLPARIEWLPEQPGDPPHTRADISRARALLRYEPAVSLAEGVGRFAEWLIATREGGAGMRW